MKITKSQLLATAKMHERLAELTKGNNPEDSKKHTEAAKRLREKAEDEK